MQPKVMLFEELASALDPEKEVKSFEHKYYNYGYLGVNYDLVNLFILK